MTVFNAASMAVDLAASSLGFLLKKRKRPVYVVMLSPLVYFVCMYPKNLPQLEKIGVIVGYLGVFVLGVIPIFLFIIAKVREARGYV